VEPEIAFLLKKPLALRVSAGRGGRRCVGHRTGAGNHRFAFDDFRFSLADVIADNASSTGYVIGPWADPRRTSATSAWC
jgi:2-oxo-3-hexenedioate decarboxylase